MAQGRRSRLEGYDSSPPPPPLTDPSPGSRGTVDSDPMLGTGCELQHVLKPPLHRLLGDRQHQDRILVRVDLFCVLVGGLVGGASRPVNLLQQVPANPTDQPVGIVRAAFAEVEEVGIRHPITPQICIQSSKRDNACGEPFEA